MNTKNFQDKTLKPHRIRKRIIFLGLCLGLAVNQVIIFQVNKAAAQNDSITKPLQTAPKSFDPLEIINAVDKYQAENMNNYTEYSSPTQYNNTPAAINSSQNDYSQQASIPYVNGYPQPNYNYQPQQNNYYTQNQQTYQTGISEYNPYRPEWIEFCPYGLENAKKDDSFHLWATNSRYKADNQNYWVERRKDFEKHLAYCDRVTQLESRNACYQKLRKRQERINANYVDPWTKAEIRNERIRQGLGMLMMYDAVKNPNIRVQHSGTVNRNINLFHY